MEMLTTLYWIAQREDPQVSVSVEHAIAWLHLELGFMMFSPTYKGLTKG
jgi:hypothetical protein